MTNKPENAKPDADNQKPEAATGPLARADAVLTSAFEAPRKVGGGLMAGSKVHVVAAYGQCVECVVESLGKGEGEVQIKRDVERGDEDGEDRIIHYSDAKAIGTWHWPNLDD